MDMRNSKKKILAKLKEAEEKLQAVYDAGEWGIAHVGAANYAHREREAHEGLQIAMYGEYIEQI